MRSLLRTACLALVFAVALALVPLTALAELGDVLHTIPCPGENPADLAWVDGELYSVIFSPTEQRGIYRLDPETGDVLGMVPYAGTMPQGLAYDGYNLWQVCLSGDCVYKMDPITGEVRYVFDAPGGDNGQPIGLGWNGASLWLNDSRDPEKIWKLDSLGTVLDQIPAPGDSPYGMAWADGFIWVSDNSVGGLAYIYKLEPESGEILDSFPCPDGGGSPNGIAHDGEHLWIAVNTTDTIYQVDDGLPGADVPEEIAAAVSGIHLLTVCSDMQSREVLVRFVSARDAAVHAQLFDLLGRSQARSVLYASAATEHEIRLPQPTTAGVYALRLQSDHGKQTGKVIVMR
jgi:streptogramin lyase